MWVGDGLTLQEKYANGPRTFLGLSSHGFPNLFFMMGPQGSPPIANYIAMGEEQAKWITDVVSHVRSGGDGATNSLPPSVSISAEGTDAGACVMCAGHASFEPKLESEQEWCEVMEKYRDDGKLWTQCNNWYNRTGQGLAIYTGDVQTYQRRMSTREFGNLVFA